MTNSCYLTNARIVLPDQTLEKGALLIENGLIAAINPDRTTAAAREVDLSGLTLMPGMIDMHCDALEKEVEPRPNVFFPIDLALSQADRRNAQAGITTVFHALSFAGDELGVRNLQKAKELVQAIQHFSATNLIDNRVHCRYEITDEASLPLLQQLIDAGQIDLLSFMDHTPGQGQFKSLSAYSDYLSSSYGKTQAEAVRLIEAKVASGQTAHSRLNGLAMYARERGLQLASHDDDSAARVATMHALGVLISEFPITLAAAQEARRLGQYTVFGAPNILRGKSQSGSIKALEAVEAEVASCLCSDYHPGSLLPAVLKLTSLANLPLHSAIALVTAKPALATGLTDRGEIVVGKRADLLSYSVTNELPQISSIWLAGRQNYTARFNYAA